MAAGNNLALPSSSSAATAILLLLVLLAPAQTSITDVAALSLLQKGLRDPNGELTSWVWDPDLPNPCSWSYVTCDHPDHRVTGIHLVGLGLSGVINRYLAKVEFPKYLEIPWNLIEGSIPMEYGQMENLVSFDLSGNWLSGSIPPQLGWLQSLVYMRIDHNQLTGPIPSDLGELHNLLFLDLASNDLCGIVLIYLERFPLSSFADNPRLKLPEMDGSRPSNLTSDDDTGC
uniref:Leucine-rich repeat-containing N-terminal plant-type domain-containing protein n=1 Tax=Leersia perrieri TaxID=77586 RepID=A0A0D9WI10_9ORYZ